MARAMVSLGMLAAFASETALRRRAFASGSPPPVRAATEISLISLVKTLPRLASKAPFLCLIVCHFECPDIFDEFPGRVLKLNLKAGRKYTTTPRAPVTRARAVLAGAAQAREV